MLIINTPSDLTTTKPSAERTAFLSSLLNDFITFDDAVYPQDYDTSLQPGDTGYIEPVIRKEWNAGAAATWGFNSRDDVEQAVQE
jgi:hypothetical protein